MKRASQLVFPALLAGLLSQPAAGEDLPSLDEIVDQAVERAQTVHEQEKRYRFRMLSTFDELHKNGDLKKRTLDVFELVRLEGKPYLRLVQRNERALSAEDIEKERERKQKFLERIREGKPPRAEEDEIRFDRDLVSRYDARVDGVETINDRPAFAVSFWPKPGRLPEHRRIERALNKSRGRIWIDRETYEVARVEFEMTGKVRFWWFLGSISELRGYYVREPQDGVWLPSHGELRINARSLFRPIRQNQKAVWTDFLPWPDGPEAARISRVER